MQQLLHRREFSLAVFIAVLAIVVSIRSAAFLSVGNIEDILNDIAILLMVALAQMAVIITGGIDLSVGSGMGLVGMAVAMMNQAYPTTPLIFLLLFSVGFGILLGSINGLCITLGNVPPIITTLGTLSIFRGFVFVLSKGNWVSAHEMTETFRNFPFLKFLGMSNLLIIAISMVVLFTVFLSQTKTGREIYAIGDNELAARYGGIRIAKIQYLVYALSGAIAGLGGFLWIARFASAQNESATGVELETVAACVIAGVSIKGGVGTVPGVVLGAILIGIIHNALTITNISPFWQMALQGFIILLAIVANTLAEKQTRKQT